MFYILYVAEGFICCIMTIDKQVLLLLLSYHRRLRMISQTLELRVGSGRVCHSCCMCVVSHGYDVLDGAGIEMVDGMHVGQSQSG